MEIICLNVTRINSIENTKPESESSNTVPYVVNKFTFITCTKYDKHDIIRNTYHTLSILSTGLLSRTVNNTGSRHASTGLPTTCSYLGEH